MDFKLLYYSYIFFLSRIYLEFCSSPHLPPKIKLKNENSGTEGSYKSPGLYDYRRSRNIEGPG